MKQTLRFGWIIWLQLLAVLVIIFLLLRECRLTTEALTGGRPDLQQVARELHDHLLGVRAASGDELLVAEIDASLEIVEKETRREYWTGLSLGTSEAAVRAPVRYRYAIRLGDGWQLLRSQEVLVVVAPAIRPVLPPAVDTAGMELRAANGWARFNAADLRDKVMRDLTGEASARAGSPAYQEAAREPARAAVGRFVRDWVVPRTATAAPVVIIRFQGESLPALPGAEHATIARTAP